MGQTVKRCDWCLHDPIDQTYHDEEWGRVVQSDQRLFEFLILEGAQAGLSWRTILKRREGYRTCYANFDPAVMARFTPKKIERLLQDTAIIRNRLKVESAVKNARAYLTICEKENSFSDYLWQFVDGTPIINDWAKQTDVPATTPQSDALSKSLKQNGFTFVGSTICYAFMQAVGMVNDHIRGCYLSGRVLR